MRASPSISTARARKRPVPPTASQVTCTSQAAAGSGGGSAGPSTARSGADAVRRRAGAGVVDQHLLGLWPDRRCCTRSAARRGRPGRRAGGSRREPRVSRAQRRPLAAGTARPPRRSPRGSGVADGVLAGGGGTPPQLRPRGGYLRLRRPRRHARQSRDDQRGHDDRCAARRRLPSPRPRCPAAAARSRPSICWRRPCTSSASAVRVAAAATSSPPCRAPPRPRAPSPRAWPGSVPSLLAAPRRRSM